MQLWSFYRSSTFDAAHVRKKYQTLHTCTTSIFMFRSVGAWEPGSLGAWEPGNEAIDDVQLSVQLYFSVIGLPMCFYPELVFCL